MYVKCPEGWSTVRKETTKYGTITVHHSKVQIYANVCDSADLCGRTTCRFYNISPEATRLFKRAKTEEHSLAALQRKLNPH